MKRLQYQVGRRWRWAMAALTCALGASAVTPVLAATPSASLYAPKVIVLTAFPPEWHAWTSQQAYHYRRLRVFGLMKPLLCAKDGVCVTETGEGEINAAVSVASLVKDPTLNVKKTIFIRSGIAGGVDVPGSPLGSVYLNDWVISWAFGHHYLSDAKTLAWAPPGCDDYSSPGQCEKYDRNSLENLAYKVDPKLLAMAQSAVKGMVLDNDPAAEAMDRQFHLDKQPQILVGATITGNDFWIGKENQVIAQKIVKLYTHGASRYANTAMEDLGDIAALNRFGLADHYLSIRGISDIDVPPPGETQESIWKKGDLYASALAERNAVKVTQAIIAKILG